MRDSNHFSGCLLGGAVGDALGAPVEFHSLESIKRQYGPEGVGDYIELNHLGLAEFTDDTQMTLFTAEGLLHAIANTGRADFHPCVAISYVYQAYLRWLRTQYPDDPAHRPPSPYEGRLLKEKGLWQRKAPGNTCLSALFQHKMGTMDHPINDSKGCGGVMRAAPVGLVFEGQEAFELGCQSAAVTHGHPTGFLTAGVLAQIIAELLAGQSLEDALHAAQKTLICYPSHEETLKAIEEAVSVYQKGEDYPPSPETVEKLGAGWVAEEALAISIYCALVGVREGSFEKGVLLAVNHSGDSDSTGSITGNLLGLIFGRQGIPQNWLSRLDMGPLLEEISEDLLNAHNNPELLYGRY